MAEDRNYEFTQTIPRYVCPIFALNDKVACEPIESMSVEKEMKGGMMVPKQKGTMTKLKVVFSSGGLPETFAKGCHVWIRAEQFTLHWAKDVFDLDGVKFILVPKDQILLVQHE